jgi:hypothetical protein
MKQFRSFLCVAAIFAIGLASCSKTGNTGPAGPAGPAGPDSVIYSGWISLSTTYNTTDSLYEGTVTASAITAGILDSGVILTYINFAQTGAAADIQPVSALNYFISEDYTVGQINILSTQDLTGLPYRYVIIPGSKTAGNSASTRKVNGYTASQLKAMSFAQAQQVISGKN